MNGDKSILEEIYSWSEKRPDWQRDALRRIIQQDCINEKDIDELYTILVEEGTPSRPLEIEQLPERRGGVTKKISLVSISNVKGINKLATDQVLMFNEGGITVIYGDNGTGKSGYTRILKNCCRSRHRESEILRNVYDETIISKQSCDIQYINDAGEEVTMNWQPSPTPNETLFNVNIFDDQCSIIHTSKKNEIAYKPFGLDVPGKLAELCRLMRDKLEIKINELSDQKKSIFSHPTWRSNTKIANLVSSLTYSTNIEEIKKNFMLSENEIKRLKELNGLLNTQNPKKVATDFLQKSGSIESLMIKLEGLSSEVQDGKVAELFLSLNKSKILSEQAESQKNGKFTTLLSGVAEELWKTMWHSAQKYSDSEAYPENQFPNLPDKSLCVLCQQMLTEDAKKRLNDFNDFMKSTIETDANSAEKEFRQKCDDIPGNVYFSEYTDVLNIIKLECLNLYRDVRRFLATIRLRSYIIRKKFKEEDYSCVLPSIKDKTINSLKSLKDGFKSQSDEYFKYAESSQVITNEKKELSNKKEVFDNISFIEEEISRLAKIKVFEDAKQQTKTNGITILGNTLADNSITEIFSAHFKKEIQALVGDKVDVNIVRSGGDTGSPQYKVSLNVDSKQNISGVLSEGEQTAVGLACFLAELSSSNNTSSLVFDDPINSLDHKWRHAVTKRLVEESRKRQIIVFTHDFVFLNDVLETSKENSVVCTSYALDRYKKSVGHVCESLPWDGQGIMEKIDTLEKEARRLKRGREDDKISDRDYKDEAKIFFSRLRESWEKAFEQVVLAGVLVRYRMYINPKHMNKITSFDSYFEKKWQVGYKRCCDYLGGHDRSSFDNQEIPDPNMLLAYTDELKVWVCNLRYKRNSVKKELAEMD